MKSCYIFRLFICDILAHPQNYRTEQCDLLLQRCRGLDETEIVDDEGGLPKVVSVENSFRRGTVCSMDSIQNALDDLYQRLPLLLNDRTSWSNLPDKAYPTTVRMTIRMVDHQKVVSRRPFVTKSKQSPITKEVGKKLIPPQQDQSTQSLLMKQLFAPLLRELLLLTRCQGINVTRLNIAVTNFQDVRRPVASGQPSSLIHATAASRKATTLPTPNKHNQMSRKFNHPKTTLLFFLVLLLNWQLSPLQINRPLNVSLLLSKPRESKTQ